MKIFFREMNGIGRKNKERLAQINAIIDNYADQGLTLTLRQLYYRLVVANIIANKRAEYQNLSVILREGRMSGVVDWDAIEDRIRRPSRPSHWSSPHNGMDAIIQQYRKDRQEGQDTYIEVMVEKDAISSVLKRVTEPLGVSILVNRGYSSVTALFDSYNRYVKAHNAGQNIVIFYLGDFDPSGLDMIRDLNKRILEFFEGAGYDDVQFEIRPIALTAEQIRTYKLPPNPAKLSDPRSEEYIKLYGRSSWEVDALEPATLHELLDTNIRSLMDMDVYDEIIEQEKRDIANLKRVKKLL
jgi:hypothetical protein